MERLCSIPGASRRPRQRQNSLEPSTALTQIPMQIPEPRERTTQAQCALSCSVFYEPVQCRAQVMVFSLEQLQPFILLRPTQCKIAPFGECQIVGSVGIRDGILFPTLLEALQCALP